VISVISYFALFQILIYSEYLPAGTVALNVIALLIDIGLNVYFFAVTRSHFLDLSASTFRV